jgi:hypothetical protein
MNELKLELKRKHLFLMSKILSKMNLKIDSETLKTNKENLQVVVGAELILKFVSNLHLAEDEADNFVADVTGYKLLEVQEMDLEEYINIWQTLFNNEKLKGFFKKAL